MKLSVQGLAPFLNKPDIPNKIIVHDVLGSTNEHAKELARSGTEHGTIVIAERQTDGKGRHGRKFFSPPGHGIYMSLILDPKSLCFPQMLTTPFAAVAVCEAIEAVSDTRPLIKWVNDILIDRKKVCGILTEAVILPNDSRSQMLVLGIGINFSVPETGFPEDLSRIAGSVFMSPDPPVTREVLAAEIINRVLDPREMRDSRGIIREYKRRLMMIGEKIMVIGMGESYGAKAIDIDDAGRLIVENSSGELIFLSSGEISVRNI